MSYLFGLLFIICLENLSMTQGAKAIYTSDGHMLEYEMDFSIPQCGSVNQALHEIIDLMKTVSICEVISKTFGKTDLKWLYGYVGCREEFQVIWNGTVKFYFLLKGIDTNFSDECLSTSATNFNHLIQKRLNLLGTRFSEVIRTKRAAITRNVVVYRLGFKYPVFKNEEIKSYTRGKRISFKNQTRFKVSKPLFAICPEKHASQCVIKK
ncbi:hypothetical protein D915_008851 [Fasciola hepatica]|uniref:Uncharacterized protein n=1 Tax=Fasciola hepatica TaxID=6192 RepID=A0A4E0QXK5_FASHE|nr:hypothetical protein D915_008851 [Fasciola hepatica]